MTNHEKIKNIAVNAVLMSLLIVLAFIPIKIGMIEMTLAVIPLSVGAIIGGKRSGILLGATFGIVSFIQCLGFSAFGVTLFGINPFLTFLVCVPTRILAGVIPALIVEFIESKKIHLRNALVSVLVPILNTVLFTSTLIICFYNTDFIVNLRNVLGSNNVFTFAILFVGINGLVEIIVGILVSFPIAEALKKYIK